jgi:cytochrome b involved in lipid metabolism
MLLSKSRPAPAQRSNGTMTRCDVISVEECEQQHGSSLSAISHSARKAIRDARDEQERKFNERLQESRSKKGEKIISRGEAAVHNRPNDLYIIIRGVVYDVTDFLDLHPGGPKALIQFAGNDGTTSFEGKKLQRKFRHHQLKLTNCF